VCSRTYFDLACVAEKTRDTDALTPRWLAGALCVRNVTKVIAARLLARKPTGGEAEVRRSDGAIRCNTLQ
jgi:S-adenosylmethionine:tRNA-ribosyltransferase-isomerase (queuine synthetase)